jgi:hypothetical protein
LGNITWAGIDDQRMNAQSSAGSSFTPHALMMERLRSVSYKTAPSTRLAFGPMR